MGFFRVQFIMQVMMFDHTRIKRLTGTLFADPGNNLNTATTNHNNIAPNTTTSQRK